MMCLENGHGDGLLEVFSKFNLQIKGEKEIKTEKLREIFVT